MHSDKLIVIGVDPGKLTGVATFWGDELRGQYEMPANRVGSWIEEYCSGLIRYNDGAPRQYFLFAVERYQIGATTVKKTRQPDAMFVTGAVQSVADRFHGAFTLQNASDAKKIGKPSSLIRMPGYVHYGDHRQDACSQVYMALARWYPSVIEPWIPSGTIE